MLWNHAGMLKTTLPLLCFFLPKNSFYLCKLFFFHFFYLLSSPVPLQKSPNNHFFDKVSTVLFFSFTYFSYFSWVWRIFYFLTFFLQGLGRQTVESGEDPIGSFLPCDTELESCWCIKAIFPLVMWHHTADPIGGFLWVSFVAFTS